MPEYINPVDANDHDWYEVETMNGLRRVLKRSAVASYLPWSQTGKKSQGLYRDDDLTNVRCLVPADEQPAAPALVRCKPEDVEPDEETPWLVSHGSDNVPAVKSGYGWLLAYGGRVYDDELTGDAIRLEPAKTDAEKVRDVAGILDRCGYVYLHELVEESASKVEEAAEREEREKAEAKRDEVVEVLARQTLDTLRQITSAFGIANKVTDEQAREWAAEAFDKVLAEDGKKDDR